MSKIASLSAALLLVLILAAPVTAQVPAPAPTPPVAARALDTDLRSHIYMMEGALQRAVAAGAQRLNREIRSVVPNIIMLSGEPQARGVYLEGYGVYFDVGVPILHQSMVWSIPSMLRQEEEDRRAIATMRVQAQKMPPGEQRTMVEGMIARLEAQYGLSRRATGDTITAAGSTPQALLGAPAGISSEGNKSDPPATLPSPAPGSAAPAAIDRTSLQDPNVINRAYTDAVQNALIDAMIDFSVPMRIAADEWLTVGARDNMQRDSLAPSDPYEVVVTILLRIKGADLAAYRTQQIDREEVRRRVQVREF
jgi:hypothetical protein